MTTTRLCKYHGRACEFPGACLNRAPRKYEGDGHLERIDPERLTIGCVVRSPNGNGAMYSFNDSVVIGICISYSSYRADKKKVDKEHFLTLSEALAAADPKDYISVKLARPMVYADNVFGSMPSWALKCEVYEAGGPQMLDCYKVVVMSTGEYDTRNVKSPLHKWEVMVNETKVYDDLSEDGAKATYKVHRQMAQGAYGRKGGETVTLLRDGKVEEEYVGGGSQ